MKRINQFTEKALNLETVSNLKGGGYFCDIYLGHVSSEGETADSSEMQEAIRLDGIAAEEGSVWATLGQGGLSFYLKYN